MYNSSGLGSTDYILVLIPPANPHIIILMLLLHNIAGLPDENSEMNDKQLTHYKRNHINTKYLREKERRRKKNWKELTRKGILFST